MEPSYPAASQGRPCPALAGGAFLCPLGLGLDGRKLDRQAVHGTGQDGRSFVAHGCRTHQDFGHVQRLSAYLTATDQQVVPLYEMEKAGAFKTGTPEGKDFVAAGLAAAAAEIRDMVVAAWRASATGKVGYPPVEVTKIESGEVDALKAAD